MTFETEETKRPKPVAYDEAPSIVSDHPFEPKGEWWTLCGYMGCNLAESAHSETTSPPFRYISDDAPEENE